MCLFLCIAYTYVIIKIWFNLEKMIKSLGAAWRWALPTSLWLTLAGPQNVSAWMWCDHLAFALRWSATHMEACYSLSPMWIKKNMLHLPHKSHGVWILPSFLSSIWYHLPSCVPAASLTTKTLPSCSLPHGTYFITLYSYYCLGLSSHSCCRQTFSDVLAKLKPITCFHSTLHTTHAPLHTIMLWYKKKDVFGLYP